MKRKISFCPVRRQTLSVHIMFYRFRCEAAFYRNLDRLPLHVRMKLDLTGIKLSLKDWLAFHIEERMGWAAHQRYALYKTAISRSEPDKFFIVLDELRKDRS